MMMPLLLFIRFLKWCEAQTKGVRTLRNGIFGKYTRTAGTVAKSHHGTIEIQPYAVFFLQFRVVGGVVELLHAVGKSGERKCRV
jgi:hypothetical protein